MLPAGRTLRARRFAPVHLAPLGSTVALADQINRKFKVSDQGIDMEIEFVDDEHEATNRKVYLQLKSGDSYTRKRKADGAEIFTIKKQRQAEYWMASPFPVLLVDSEFRGRSPLDGGARLAEAREGRWQEAGEADHLRG